MTLAWSLLGNRFGQIGLAFLVGYFFAVYQIPRVDVKAIERNAMEARDAHWQRQLNAERETYEKRIQLAQEAAESEPDTPADLDERMRLCASSATCRDKNRR